MENLNNNLPLNQIALQVAIEHIGDHEDPKGSNAGPMVTKFLAAVGLGPGYSWCQAFFFYCYLQACLIKSAVNPVIKTAGVLACWNKTAVQFKITVAEARAHPELILPGYQFILKEGNNGNGHTGMIELIEIIGAIVWLHTIEGNSNTDGSREGWEVVRHKRLLSETDLVGFIKY